MPTPSTTYVPEGMHSLTTQLWFSGNCQEAIAFYEKAFGAKKLTPPMMGEDGKTVMHIMMQIGDSQIMMADAWPGSGETGPQDYSTAGLYLYVEDADAALATAAEAGCETIFPCTDMFWGDRMGKVRDPFGHGWGISTLKQLMTPEEIVKGQQDWLATMKETGKC